MNYLSYVSFKLKYCISRVVGLPKRIINESVDRYLNTVHYKRPGGIINNIDSTFNVLFHNTSIKNRKSCLASHLIRVFFDQTTLTHTKESYLTRNNATHSAGRYKNNGHPPFCVQSINRDATYGNSISIHCRAWARCQRYK